MTKTVAVRICKEVAEIVKVVVVIDEHVEEVREEETSCDGLGGSDGRLVHQQIH